MKAAIVLWVILSVSWSSPAQDTIIPLWIGEIPNRVHTEEQEVHQRDGILRISKVQSPEVAVFLPDSTINTGKGILVFPGGGYHILAYDWEGTEVARWLNSKGVAAFVVKYRLPVSESLTRPYEVPLMDAQRAMRLVRGMHMKWGLAPDKIGVMGFSAGGHLAASLGTLHTLPLYDQRDSFDTISARPDFMALIYPVITFTEKSGHQGSLRALLGKDPQPELVQRFSLERQINEETPPTFLLHAMDDKGVPPENSLLFYKGLLNKGVPSALHILPRGGHGFSLAVQDPYLNQWTGLFTSWLDQLH